MEGSVTQLPIASMVTTAGLVVVGMLLWSAGGRVLRPAFATAGLFVGAGLGWAAAKALGQTDIAISVPPWLGAILAGLVLASFAALIYRLLVAAALGGVAAVASAALVLAFASPTPDPSTFTAPEEGPPVTTASTDDGDPTIIDEASDWLFGDEPDTVPADARAADDDATTEHFELPKIPSAAIGLDDQTRERIDAARGWIQEVADLAQTQWAQLPPHLRPALIGAVVSAFVVGLMLGTLTPGFSVTLVTAFGGSLLWLVGLRLMLVDIGAPASFSAQPAFSTALAIWTAVSMLGTAIQWTFRPGRADRRG